MWPLPLYQRLRDWLRNRGLFATDMHTELVEKYLRIIPAVMAAPQKYLWSSYDSEADVLYVNFKKPSHATDSELTDDDILIRYEGEEIIGLTVLHASKRG
jgi:uncharacterized protein YuzE